MEKLQAAIIDIDGTLALHEGLRGHYEYGKVLQDLPNSPVIDLVSRMVMANSTGLREIVPLFVSGRMDCNEGQVRRDTIQWLSRYCFAPYADELFMRQEFLPDGKNDYRPDFIVKEEIYHNLIKPKYDVLYAIDDRKQVVDMWRRLGITCFQCAEGNF